MQRAVPATGGAEHHFKLNPRHRLHPPPNHMACEEQHCHTSARKKPTICESMCEVCESASPSRLEARLSLCPGGLRLHRRVDFRSTSNLLDQNCYKDAPAQKAHLLSFRTYTCTVGSHYPVLLVVFLLLLTVTFSLSLSLASQFLFYTSSLAPGVPPPPPRQNSSRT